jgi:hypothetical protein
MDEQLLKRLSQYSGRDVIEIWGGMLCFPILLMFILLVMPLMFIMAFIGWALCLSSLTVTTVCWLFSPKQPKVGNDVASPDKDAANVG